MIQAAYNPVPPTEFLALEISSHYHGYIILDNWHIVPHNFNSKTKFHSERLEAIIKTKITAQSLANLTMQCYARMIYAIVLCLSIFVSIHHNAILSKQLNTA